jgi:predicted dehydrogenase
MASKHVLIVGSGSVGKRHARNLAALGCTISCVDPRPERRAELSAEVPVKGSYSLESEALQAERFDGVVIASPPPFHTDQALQALEQRIPVLLEKPVSPDLDGALRIEEAVAGTGSPLLLGYTWRWWPPLAELRKLLEAETAGKLRYVQFYMSAHLADWHPWERYQDFFMAKRELGGGALLDESHWIDLMLWFFGMPVELSGRVEKISELEIDTDDNVDLLFVYPEGLRVAMHLDLYGRPHEKFIRFVGDGGTIAWSAEPNRIAVGKTAEQSWNCKDFECQRNDMFVAVAEDFIGVMEGKTAPKCTIADGVNVLRVIEAARQASREGRPVTITHGV